MIIDRISLYHVRMPLIYPFRTAFDNVTHIESILVKFESGEYVGWGETSPWESPCYSPDWAQSTFLVIEKFLAPRIIGQNITSGEDLQERMSFIKGNQFAKAGMDLAWWDLYAKSQNKPLWKVLGGVSDTVQVGADFGIMESVDRLCETIDTALKQGFQRVKLKYRPGWELNMISQVRKNFPTAVFHVDCNSAYTLEQADMLKALDDYDLAMIEQPLYHDDLIDHAKLQKVLKTPICLDESINSPRKARQAIEIGACGFINIKPGRVGGITNALEIQKIARSAGIPLWVGGMLESSVGAAHCIALATLPGMEYPSDIFPADRFYRIDLAAPATVLSSPSQVCASILPGIGVAPVPEQLNAYTIEYKIIDRPFAL